MTNRFHSCPKWNPPFGSSPFSAPFSLISWNLRMLLSILSTTKRWRSEESTVASHAIRALRVVDPKTATAPATCPGALIIALPTKVPPKKAANGIMKWPQQMPHRSNAALGYALKASTPQKPNRLRMAIIFRFITVSRSWLCSSSLSSSLCWFPSLAAEYDTRYGGISPRAVPAPHRKPAGSSFKKRLVKEGGAASAPPVPHSKCTWWVTAACHMLMRESKLVWPQPSAKSATLRMCGNKKSMPECMPVPRPMEDSTPSPTHHTT
mmetsp:Transcript_35469/g.59779  ORF Transcript_35469/g.59779 Transcript_35469/m.59779 type:complete len:265 (-) Transcript_35469:494-1288(-)